MTLDIRWSRDQKFTIERRAIPMTTGVVARRRKGKPYKPGADNSNPTPERMGHAGEAFEVGGDERTGKIIRVLDSPLDRLLSQEKIDGRQYAAICKFRHHWHHGGLEPTVGSVDLNRVFAPDFASFAGMAKSERQAFHRQQYREAVRKMGMRISNVVEKIACMDCKVEAVGHELGWSHPLQARASATEMLITGGDILADLWKLPVA